MSKSEAVAIIKQLFQKNVAQGGLYNREEIEKGNQAVQVLEDLVNINNSLCDAIREKDTRIQQLTEREECTKANHELTKERYNLACAELEESNKRNIELQVYEKLFNRIFESGEPFEIKVGERSGLIQREK